jgi:hypothetical protein
MHQARHVWLKLALCLLVAPNYCCGLLQVEIDILKQLAIDYPILQQRGWSTTNPQCDLIDGSILRIGCGDSVVKQLDLSGLGLSGTIPAYLGLLPWVRLLYLNRNNFNGTIPQELANGTIRDQSQVTPWVNQLNTLLLDQNNLEGPIPEIFNNLTSLQVWTLNDNPRLNGTLPRFLPDLRQLWAQNTSLSGTLPDFEATLLRVLYLSGTQVSGTIPPSIGNLTSLEYLYLDRTGINGSIPAELVQCSRLIALSIYDARLTGEIPGGLLGLPLLQEVLLGNNSLNGSILSSGDISRSLTALSLRSNKLSGSIPDAIYNATSLRTLDLTENMLTGTISPNINLLRQLSVLSFGDNRLEGTLPQLNISTLTQLWVYSNNLSGTLPPFNRIGALNILHLAWNHFEGTIPPLNSLTNLQYALFQGNNLTGCIGFVAASQCSLAGNAVCGCTDAVCDVAACPAPVSSPFTAPSSASGTPASFVPVATPSESSGPLASVATPSLLSPAEARSLAINYLIGIIVGVVIGLALIVLGIVFFYRRRRSAQQRKESASSVMMAPISADVSAIDAESQQRISAAKDAAAKGLKPEWIIPFEDLVFGKRLGEGAFGIVFKGRWKSTEVAYVAGLSCIPS